MSQQASAARQRAAAGKRVRKGTSLSADRQYWRVRKDFFEKDAPDQQTDTKFVKALKAEHKTLKRVLRRFWWKNAEADVGDWVASCAVCQSVKPRPGFPDDVNAADWDLYATNVEFASNDSRCKSTGFTPFELCCGVSPLSQLDMFLEAAKLDAGRRTGGVGTAHEFAAKFSSQLRDARQRLEMAQQRQRQRFDERHAQRQYAVGDMVWVEAKHLTEKVMDRSLCRKLSKKWHGPLPVVERFFSDAQMELAGRLIEGHRWHTY
ncbi:hypothetical protein CYMTET_24189 [Cymbomonas tetramitiformis]|uniref:Integrase zinc-binding domain-containing protein n=1 Tax=Cymbomonas tetramitiformis TaxID=36881 RepID=A0AAE0L051_9CHLO|nr:hypothetical protein CYMTET_24189 [Cymbomonas tetramitiformis]